MEPWMLTFESRRRRLLLSLSLFCMTCFRSLKEFANGNMEFPRFGYKLTVKPPWIESNKSVSVTIGQFTTAISNSAHYPTKYSCWNNGIWPIHRLSVSRLMAVWLSFGKRSKQYSIVLPLEWLFEISYLCFLNLLRFSKDLSFSDTYSIHFMC